MQPDIKILVTGGAGYIGSVVTRKLLEQGYNVRVIDSLMYGDRGLKGLFRKNNFEFIQGDMQDSATVNQALEGVNIIIHLAAIVGDPACKRQPKLLNKLI